MVCQSKHQETMSAELWYTLSHIYNVGRTVIYTIPHLSSQQTRRGMHNIAHGARSPKPMTKTERDEEARVAAHAAKNQSVTSHNPDDVFRVWPDQVCTQNITDWDWQAGWGITQYKNQTTTATVQALPVLAEAASVTSHRYPPHITESNIVNSLAPLINPNHQLEHQNV